MSIGRSLEGQGHTGHSNFCDLGGKYPSRSLILKFWFVYILTLITWCNMPWFCMQHLIDSGEHKSGFEPTFDSPNSPSYVSYGVPLVKNLEKTDSAIITLHLYILKDIDTLSCVALFWFYKHLYIFVNPPVIGGFPTPKASDMKSSWHESIVYRLDCILSDFSQPAES